MKETFEAIAQTIAAAAGKPQALLAVAVIVLWACAGPVFGYSETWQLLVNTTTTIVTFLMMFLLQATLTSDTIAVQAKLDELIVATEGARNELERAEDKTTDELERLRHGEPT